MPSQVCRLLHLDDDPEQRARVAVSLRSSLPFGQVDLQPVTDPATFERLLEGSPADCVITDYRLGWTDASEVLRLVRDRWPSAGVVLFTDGVNEETVARLIKNGVDDFLLKTPDGETRLVAAIEAVVRQRRNELDVEQKHHELLQLRRRLIEGDGRWQRTFEAVPIGLWRGDPQGRLLEANPALRTILGLDDTGDLPQIDILDFLAHFDERANLILQLREQHRVAGYETKLRRLDGSTRWARIDATVLNGPDGKPLFMEGSVTDITEREEARRRLTVSERQFRALFERSNVGQTVVELPSKRIVRVNGRFCTMLGYARAELVGRCLTDIWHPDKRDDTLNSFEDLIADGPDDFDHERQCVRKDGTTIWMQATGTVLRDERGVATHTIASVYDTTARRAEDHKLRERQRDAQLASEAKDRFLAQLSHELRTPLTPALTAAAVLSMDDRLPEDVRGDLEIIRRNIELEARLIDDLLDLNRAVSGKLKLRLETFDLTALLHEARSICAEDAAAKKIHVSLDVAADVGHIHADRTRIEQVAWNLLKNAVKFTPPGGRIEVRCQRMGDEVMLYFRDSGVGIEPELIDRIFGNFEQGRTTNSLNPGLGLGLAVARAIVSLHGGTITACSDGPGTGSTFAVRLPAKVLPDTHAADAGLGEKQIRGRLLLVEDHADTAAVLGKFLRRSGFSVRLAHSLADARTALIEMDAAGEEADVLLSDLDLPDGRGHELVAEIIAKNAERRPLAIAFSGHGTEEDLRESRDAGFDEHLIKPVPPDVLLNALRRMLQRRRRTLGEMAAT